MSSKTSCHFNLLEGLLNDSSMNFSQIKKIYASFDDYQIDLCSFSDSNTALEHSFSFIGTCIQFSSLLN